jgi:hypothetical protein
MTISNQWPSSANMTEFSYSKLSHFELFRNLPFVSYNVGDPDPAICDLKVYQDYLTYCFIARNIPPGSRILEIGGGDSRILRYFSEQHECWNIDKYEGIGAGPVEFTSPHYRIVYDYIGEHSTELPDHYFDLVFSISALEHTPGESPAVYERILKDIHRVLKPKCPSFHCFDAVLRTAGKSWMHDLVFYLQDHVPLQMQLAPLDDIAADSDTYAMSQLAYDALWQYTLNQSYAEFGRPFSLNLLWFAP